MTCWPYQSFPECTSLTGSNWLNPNAMIPMAAFREIHISTGNATSGIVHLIGACCSRKHRLDPYTDTFYFTFSSGTFSEMFAQNCANAMSIENNAILHPSFPPCPLILQLQMPCKLLKKFQTHIISKIRI